MSFIFYDNTKKRYVLSYSISTPKGKKRKRLFFKTKKLATEAKRTHDANQKSYGKVSNFDLDKYQKFLMIEEYADGIDLIKAIDFYKESYRVATDRSFSAIIKPYLDSRKNKNVSNEWMVTIRGYLEKVKSHFKNARIDKITRMELESYLGNMPYSMAYKDNVRRAIKSVFKYAKSVGWCKTNPASDLEPYIEDGKKVEFIGLECAIKFFKSIEDNYPEYIPFSAIRAFAGMRTTHVKRLSWDNINFEEKGIRVVDKGKSDLDFIQGFPENLWVWLEAYKKYPIFTPKLDRKIGKYIRHIGVMNPRNGFRHAFGTYHLTLFKDASLTSYLMQHKGAPRTLYKFYKGLSSERTASDYFSIIPKT